MRERELEQQQRQRDPGRGRRQQRAAASCSNAAIQGQLFAKGQLTVATDKPVYPPWFVNNKPTNGQGYESAVAYAVAAQLGFSKSQVTWAYEPFNSSYARDEEIGLSAFKAVAFVRHPVTASTWPLTSGAMSQPTITFSTCTRTP